MPKLEVFLKTDDLHDVEVLNYLNNLESEDEMKKVVVTSVLMYKRSPMHLLSSGVDKAVESVEKMLSRIEELNERLDQFQPSFVSDSVQAPQVPSTPVPVQIPPFVQGLPVGEDGKLHIVLEGLEGLSLATALPRSPEPENLYQEMSSIKLGKNSDGVIEEGEPVDLKSIGERFKC